MSWGEQSAGAGFTSQVQPAPANFSSPTGVPGTTSTPPWFSAMATTLNRFEELCGHTNSLVDALIGSVSPQPTAESKSALPACGGMFGELEDLANQAHRRLAYVLSRVIAAKAQLPK